MLKIERGQPEQVLEDMTAKHGVDTVPRMQHQILPYPGQCSGKYHEHTHADRHRNEGALGAMDHNLVDNGLCEQGKTQRQDLQNQGSDEDFTPDCFVLQQLRDEPVKAERPPGAH